MEMDIIKMSSKGQIVIPSSMRSDINKGEEFIIIRDDGRFVLKRTKLLTEQMREDFEFARRTEKALREVEKGNFTSHSTEEFFKIMNGS